MSIDAASAADRNRRRAAVVRVNDAATAAVIRVAVSRRSSATPPFPVNAPTRFPASIAEGSSRCAHRPNPATASPTHACATTHAAVGVSDASSRALLFATTSLDAAALSAPGRARRISASATSTCAAGRAAPPAVAVPVAVPVPVPVVGSPTR